MKFQARVREWAVGCFGHAIASDKVERNYRFLEEALELVQALGCAKEDALKLVDYVYGRPVGEPNQEVGGVMVSLAALCAANHMMMKRCAWQELRRCWDKIEHIRKKQAAKVIKSGPLP